MQYEDWSKTKMDDEDLYYKVYDIVSIHEGKQGHQVEIAMKDLATACIAFLRDWGNPEDFNTKGLGRMLQMGLLGGVKEGSWWKSPLDELFDEIESGYRVVPAATGSECNEILTYHKMGLLTNDQLVAFSQMPSFENYKTIKVIAEENKQAVEKFLSDVALPWEKSTEDDAEQDGQTERWCTDIYLNRQVLKQKTSYVRNSDAYAPGYMQKADGTYGIAPEDDFALRAYHIYKAFPHETKQTAVAMLASTVCL